MQLSLAIASRLHKSISWGSNLICVMTSVTQQLSGKLILADVSDIFYFFFCFGVRGERGGTFNWKYRERRGFQEGEAGWSTRRWQDVAGRGAKVFFSGPKCPPSNFVTLSASTVSVV